MSTRPFEIGLFTFGEITADPLIGRPMEPAVRLREFIELAKIGDQAGLDVFGVGEHHRPDDGVLADCEVLIAPHQHAENPRSKLPQQVLDANVRCHVLISSMTSSGGASMH